MANRLDYTESTDGSESGQFKCSDSTYIGLEPTRFYAFDDACAVLAIGKKHATKIRRKYKEKLHKWGHDICCYGRDMIEIFIEESSNYHDGNQSDSD